MTLQPHKIMMTALAGLNREIDTRNPFHVAQYAAESRPRGPLARTRFQNFTNASMHSETARALHQVETNSFEAIEKLSAIGYDRLRHIRANGLTFPEISRDMGINVNDIIEFMRLSPTAYEDAIQDEEACADARTMRLEEYVKNEPLLSRNDTVRLQLITNIQLEMNKRLSPKWAKGADLGKENGVEGGAPATITMIINNEGRAEPQIEAQPKKEVRSERADTIEAEFRIGLPGE